MKADRIDAVGGEKNPVGGNAVDSDKFVGAEGGVGDDAMDEAVREAEGATV